MNPKVGIFEYGQRVRIIDAVRPLSGRVVELRGPLGPGGMMLYRVRMHRKFYTEFLEDQLEPIPDKVSASSATASV